ncbi:hypothetical protein Q8A73_009396 [Channa argus]|nr:hypothetical protein Q8A73_009396 [Channa argus]
MENREREWERDGETKGKIEREQKLAVSNTPGIINQISHNPLRRGPSLGLVRTRSVGRGASIGVATPMLTVPGSEGERGKGAMRGGVLCMCITPSLTSTLAPFFSPRSSQSSAHSLRGKRGEKTFLLLLGLC